MSQTNTKKRNVATRFLRVAVVAVALLLAVTAHAAVPGITGTSFSLTAQASYLSQPDGVNVYSWGYGCASGHTPAFLPFPGNCPTMQVPGPTVIVTEGSTFTVTLINGLPAAAGHTSILFPGLQLISTSGGTAGLMTQEAAPGDPVGVTYTLKATTPGTRAYYSGTQPDLQIEMGLYGAVVVLPAHPPTNCAAFGSDTQLLGKTDYRLAPSAYDHPSTCYDREYLFQFAEIDPRIHRQAEAQASGSGPMKIVTEPYHPNYFLINGRSMPDDMDPDYVPMYPHQPYNGNPHMHPGDLVLIRVLGQGHWQHPFHEHGAHVRILARDGNLILSQTDPTKLGGRMEFTTDTTPGQAFDGIFYWSGKGLNWDIYNHVPGDSSVCSPDQNGYYTVNSPSPAPLSAPNYYEWCADHLKPLDTANGGAATPPDPLVVTNGLWYAGNPYLGLPSRTAGGNPVGPTPLAPGASVQNPEGGIAFMWHSHNEREITTNDVFPGGMLMMMLVDPPVFFIDETL